MREMDSQSAIHKNRRPHRGGLHGQELLYLDSVLILIVALVAAFLNRKKV